MTGLKKRIIEKINEKGPIPIDEYMFLCLSDPSFGYYMKHEPFGHEGDFITSPEISQMFGELIGAWIIETWHLSGKPSNPVMIEAGPGRGTLMKDIVRTTRQISPLFMKQASWYLIETSPRLQAIQEKTLQECNVHFSWIEKCENLPEGFIFIIGNEFLDALPMKQFVWRKNTWKERCVTHSKSGTLTFSEKSCNAARYFLPSQNHCAKEGAIKEKAPQRCTFMEKIGKRIRRNGGIGLFIDYGYYEPDTGNSLQALYKKRFDHPLAHPGEADLSSHVDFSSLMETLRLQDLEPILTDQGNFLLETGLAERLFQLTKSADTAMRIKMQNEARRLASPLKMGTLFKVLGVAWPKIELPGFAFSKKNLVQTRI